LDPQPTSKLPWIIGAGVLVLILVALAAFLAL
jgi:hypothetical protein